MVKLNLDVDRLLDICQRHSVAKVGVFGSYSRGEETQDSDVDLLVEFDQRTSLLGVVRLERELSEALNRKVDVLTEAAISPYLKDRILEEVQFIYF